MYFFDCTIASYIAWILTGLAIPIFLILLFVPAWYGRYTNMSESKCHINLGSLSPRLSWILQECPSFFIPLFGLIYGIIENSIDIHGCIMIIMFMTHYVNRSFIYPFRIKSTHRVPTEIFLMAVTFCLLNGYIQASYYITSCAPWSNTLFKDICFLLGFLLFIIGMTINIYSDNELISLRQSSEGEYLIPQKGLFQYISGANYFGECIEWFGYAIASWNLAGLSFAVFTIANIGPRALKHHQYYKDHFGNSYPTDRKALIPFIL
ncbi:hypothetical protein WA158_000105 [Blastocystis sp. Blastoise]